MNEELDKYKNRPETIKREAKNELVRELKGWTEKQRDDVSFDVDTVLSHLSWLEQKKYFIL